MAFCERCGAQVTDGVLFCPNCGAQMSNGAPVQGSQNQQYQQNPQYQQNQQDQQGYPNNGPVYMNSNPNQAGPGAYVPLSDAEENKIMGVLAYLSWLVLIPIFAAPRSKFARFHANQGLVLAIVEIGYGIIQIIFTAILAALFTTSWSARSGGVYLAIFALLNLVWIFFGVLSILGIINAINGEEKELPLIGKIKILK